MRQDQPEHTLDERLENEKLANELEAEDEKREKEYEEEGHDLEDQLAVEPSVWSGNLPSMLSAFSIRA
jgi:hypothetical protein